MHHTVVHGSVPFPGILCHAEGRSPVGYGAKRSCHVFEVIWDEYRSQAHVYSSNLMLPPLQVYTEHIEKLLHQANTRLEAFEDAWLKKQRDLEEVAQAAPVSEAMPSAEAPPTQAAPLSPASPTPREGSPAELHQVSSVSSISGISEGGLMWDSSRLRAIPTNLQYILFRSAMDL